MRNNQPVTGVEHPMREDQSLISRTDTSGNITYVNQAFIEMSGFAEEELLGAPHNIVRHPDMPVEAFADLWATLKSGNSWTGMVKNRRKNGDHYWVLANATPIRENGVVVGYTSVRTAPSRAQVDATAKVYALFKEGRSGSLRIRQGQAVRTGILGKIAGLKELNIKGRLIAVVGMLCLFMVGVGVLGLNGMAASNRGLQTTYDDRVVPLGQLDAIIRLMNRNRLAVAKALDERDPDKAKSTVAEIEKNIEVINKTWDAYLATYLTPKETKLAEQFALDQSAFLSKGLRPTMAAFNTGNFDEAKQLKSGPMTSTYAPVSAGIDSLIQLQLDVAKEEMEKAHANYAFTRNMVVAAIGLGFVFSFLMVSLLLRSIVRPLDHAVNAAKQIAAGNLTAKIEARSNDELGQLQHALNVMEKSLANIISDVWRSAELIGSASGQIAAGNADLARRTEDQAASLEETASSMEELTATVKQNAENSNTAKQLAHAASDIAVQGGEVMGQVVGTMDSIADSSKRITDIIGVIDGIAFQTNILALNAAVEAARAGEQGRGFAVVASEVRSLAQRSAAAAKEIKDLISDSVAKVEGGSKQVTQARQTMDDIVSAVKQFADIMNEISTASREQSSGIEQVSQAVIRMDTVTQQNATVVEEAATAAISLQLQGSTLVKAMGVFRL
jgi:PAS domain S-box-containing protein